MKRTERHHLKENELEKFARRAREAFETRRRETMAAVVALLVIGVVAIGYLHHDRTARAGPVFDATHELHFVVLYVLATAAPVPGSATMRSTELTAEASPTPTVTS